MRRPGRRPPPSEKPLAAPPSRREVWQSRAILAAIIAVVGAILFFNIRGEMRRAATGFAPVRTREGWICEPTRYGLCHREEAKAQTD